MADAVERIDTVVIGAGQAGLAAGHHLARQGMEFVVLEANGRVGDGWRDRWESLLLFTPARYNALPGMRFPARGSSYIGKDAMADYLEAYADRSDIRVRTSVGVTGLQKQGTGFLLSTTAGPIDARHVIVAAGSERVPRVPAFAHRLDPAIVQLHSSEYGGPGQIPEGPVLVVGVGNSGADISMELVRSHPTWAAGDIHAAVPFRIEPWIARNVLLRLVRFAGMHVLTEGTPMGRKFRARFLAGGAPLVRVKPNDMIAAGVERVGRVAGVRDGRPELQDGTILDPASVVWCTGFRRDYSWIDVPDLTDAGEVVHRRGVSRADPALCFVGLPFQYAATSLTITGVGRDAKYVVRHLASMSNGTIMPSRETTPARAAPTA